MSTIYFLRRTGLATINADGPVAMLDRLCSFLLEALPSASIPYLRGLVSEAVDVCVHITKDSSSPGGRRISGIIYVNGVDGDGNWITEALE